MMDTFKQGKYCRSGQLAVTLVLVFGAAELSAQLEEVVVTAQKREQNIQDVPIAITALGGGNIAGLGFKTAADIQYQVPGLIVSYSSTNAIPNFVLRGVGLNDFTAIQSSPVAVHVDEVYYGNSTLLNFALFDLERVEVLKGPQGTLFGRNSTGGAINFFSASPTDEFDAGLTLGLSKYESMTGEAYVNGPLSETVSGRLSMSTTYQNGGPFEHPRLGEIGEQEKYAFRGQLSWDVSEQLSARLTVFGGEDESEGNQYQGLPTYSNDGSGEICAPISAGNLGVSPACSFDGAGAALLDDGDPFTLTSGVINRDEIKAFGTVFSIDYELWNEVTLTSITGYNEVERQSQEDADGSMQRNIDVGYETDFVQFSEELRFSSSGDGPWTWTFGLFYSTDELDTPLTETDLTDLFEDFRQSHTYKLETDSFALFLHDEYRLTDRLSVIGGLRYTSEERAFRGGTFDVPPGAGPSPAGDFVASFKPVTPGEYYAFLEDEITFEEVSWTVGAHLDISDQAMLYARIANGFKSGGFIGDITEQPILEEPYDEETLTAYEIGLKSDLLNGGLRWNTTLFYYDYQDIILALSIEGSGLDTLLINENGADAEIYGLESEIRLAPADGLEISFGVVWMDSEMSGIQTSPFDVSERLEGNEMPYAPEFSANGMVRYEVPAANGYSVYGQFDFTTRGEHWAESDNVNVSRIDGYTLLNARFGIRIPGNRGIVTVWVKKPGG